MLGSLIKTSVLAGAMAFAAGAAQAAIVDIDLSGAVGGTLVTGVGANFAQSFTGQTVVGTGLSGSPTGPLSLQPAGTINVAFWDPVVSPAGNSLLSQPGNAAPLAVRLGSTADSFTFTAGSASGGSVNYSFFGMNGTLLGGGNIALLSGYNVYNISNAAAFLGVSFTDNNDPAGLRFMSMSYNSVAVPEPATWAMLIVGFGLVGVARRRRATVITA